PPQAAKARVTDRLNSRILGCLAFITVLRPAGSGGRKAAAAGQPRTLTPPGRRPAGVKGHDPGRRQWPPFAVRSPHLQHGCPCFRAVTILVCPPRPMARLSYPARPFRRADTARNNPDAVIPLLAARFWIAPGKPRPIPANATPRVPPAAPGCFSE